jgi:hypothetical protein
LHCSTAPRPPPQPNPKPRSDPYSDLIPRKKLPDYAIALIVIAAAVALAAVGVIAFLVVRERRGNPYFKTWQDTAGSGLQGTL